MLVNSPPVAGKRISSHGAPAFSFVLGAKRLELADKPSSSPDVQPDADDHVWNHSPITRRIQKPIRHKLSIRSCEYRMNVGQQRRNEKKIRRSNQQKYEHHLCSFDEIPLLVSCHPNRSTSPVLT
jgi:hypothetical protein